MKTAVVLFNLGGPDSPEAVAPFLNNLFSDPAIIALPQPLRWLVAKLIAGRRAPVARDIYARIGGRSPIRELTEAQGKALSDALHQAPGRAVGDEFQVFIAMRYWHPLAGETVKAVVAFEPDQVLLLPLYPQYSSTTTGSSAADWRKAAKAAGLSAPTRLLCCYPAFPRYTAALTRQLIAAIAEAKRRGGKFRVLLSAHGLPKKVVASGDPYQWQVERTAAAIIEGLPQGEPLDWLVCYQSRVGPLEWIGPATEAEIHRAGAAGLGLIVLPIAFVSEHSETLVELDMEYRDLAGRSGVPFYIRVPALGTDPGFIGALTDLVQQMTAGDSPIAGGEGGRICPPGCTRCPNAA
jgi:protoporphyrin/coproporphyrin ferrochelatase